MTCIQAVRHCVGKERVLTVFGPCDVREDTERLGLQVGSTASPFRKLVLFILCFYHSLVYWRGTVHQRIFDKKRTVSQRQ